MRFCEKLAVKRKQNNLSQEQFADTLGVSRQAVSKWESGTSYPDMDKIIKMTQILNCTLEDLLDDGTIGKNRRKENPGASPEADQCDQMQKPQMHHLHRTGAAPYLLPGR